MLNKIFIISQKIFTCGKFLFGNFIILLFPVIKPKTKEYAKFKGTFEGDM